MRKRGFKPAFVLAAALLAALLCELLVFNRTALSNRGGSWTAMPAPELSGDLARDGSCSFTLQDPGLSVRSCRIRLRVWDSAGKPYPTVLKPCLTDEGSSAEYSTATVRYLSEGEEGYSFPLRSYGRVRSLRFVLLAEKGCSCVLESLELNGPIPLRLSWKRMALLWLLALLLWALRPGSALYDNRLWNRLRRGKAAAIALLLAVELLLLIWLTGLNTPFVSIPEDSRWAHHHQYYRLSVALAEGRTWIDGPEDAEALAILDGMEDPYDIGARGAAFSSGVPFRYWDTAYRDGHLYVYFGVVPALLSYLPWYLLTGRELPTVWAVRLSFALVLLGAFLLLRALIRRWFPRTPLPVCLLLSLLLGCCSCVLCYALAPSFYTLPVSFALGFSYLALALWVSAGERWTAALGGRQPLDAPQTLCFRPAPAGRGVGWRLALGSLCGALTAGCRPQFLVFSALLPPLLLGPLRREQRSRAALRLLCAALPYVLTAAALMAYNALRFGSPFDFGANYNLTTNNMPLRGWTAARLPDGLFEYLFRAPNADLVFPFFHETPLSQTYMGLSIREPMYGGALLVHPFLWALLGLRRAWPALKQKGLRCLVLLPLLLTLLVVAADTEMAGILWRYTGDFLPLLYLSAALVFLTRAEAAQPPAQRRARALLLAAVCVSLTVCLLIGISDGALETRAPESFYRLKTLFCG